MDSKFERRAEEVKNLPSKITATLVGSIILTVLALVASWPASAFFWIYYTNPQDTGAILVGSGFAVLAVVLWGVAIQGWSKIYKTRKS